MKKIILICSVIMLLACDAQTRSVNTSLINNFLYFGAIENVPQSKIILKQTLFGSEYKEIHSNSDGLITFISTNGLELKIDYQTANTYFRQNNQTSLNFEIKYDDNRNIVKMLGIGHPIIWESTFDDNGKIMKIARSTDLPIILDTTDFFYDNDRVSKVTTQISYNNDEKSTLILNNEKKLFYNDNDQLSKILIEIQEYNPFEQNENNRLISNKSTECFFYDYNENGNWTKSYCFSTKSSETYFVIRELQY